MLEVDPQGRTDETGEWWRTLVEALPDAVIVHCRGRIVFANATAAVLFGAERADVLLGRRAFDLVHPQSRALARRRSRQVLASGCLMPATELRWLRLDGSSFWGEGRPSRVSYRGRPAVLAVITDVTARRQEQQRLRDFAELASDWFWEMGPDLRYTWFSPDVQAKTGVPAEWHYGKTREEIVGPDSDPPAIAENLRLMHMRLPYRDLEFQRAAPGRLHWIRSNGKPLFDEDGNFLGYRGTGRDITAEKQAEIALRESEERYRRLVELSPNAIIVEVHGRIRYANPRAASMLGAGSVDELIGRSVLEFVDPADHEPFRQHLREMRQTCDALPLELRLMRPDGVERWVEARAAQVVDRGEAAVLLVATDITDRRRSEARLAHLARHDALTGLANRMLLTDRLEQALRVAGREQHLAALLLVDLDGFKGLNDTFGHGFGDRVLQVVAERLQREVRSCDTVGRLGGDEFAVVLPHLQTVIGAEVVAGRLIEALARPFTLDGRACRIGASIGLAIGPEHGETADELLRAADLALYRAKDLGRGCWVAFVPEMARHLEDRREIEAALRQHLADDDLKVHYQPVVELATGRIVGAEALVRWPDGAARRIPPELFVAIAERSGLIRQLGRRVLEHAVRDCRRFCDIAGRQLRLAVNVSPHELTDRGYASDVIALLRHCNIPDGMLELEITERVLLERSGEIADTLARLEAAGVRLAIDDFGTGYSSFLYLKRFPVHRLKLDQSFVRGLPDDAEDRAIVEAIRGLARAFRLSLLAEGVEQLRQAECLRSLGIEEAQGYFWAPPVPPSVFENLLRCGLLERGILPVEAAGIGP